MRSAGYGDGWSQGIRRQYTIEAPPGTPLSIEFFHRYAVETGFDTCFVETSYDGLFWNHVGSEQNPGFYGAKEPMLLITRGEGVSQHQSVKYLQVSLADSVCRDV